MDYQETLTIERYKLVTSRQTWLADTVRNTFTSYTTTLAAFVAVAVSLTSATKALDALSKETLSGLLLVIACFLTCAAIATLFQIDFCLKQYRAYRLVEHQLNPSAPAFLQEEQSSKIAYMTIVIASLLLVWIGYFTLPALAAISRT